MENKKWIKSIYEPKMEDICSGKTVCWDMDNTLINERGNVFGPGMDNVLYELKRNGYKNVIWTNSRKERSLAIIKAFKKNYFDIIITRESYDLDEIKTKFPSNFKRIFEEYKNDSRFQFQLKHPEFKNLDFVGGKILIEDDPEQKKLAEAAKCKFKVIIVPPFKDKNISDKIKMAEHRKIADNLKKHFGV